MLLAATVLLAAAAKSNGEEGLNYGRTAAPTPSAGMAADAVAGHILRRTLPPDLRMRRPHAAGSAAAGALAERGGHAAPGPPGPPPCPATLAARIKVAGHLSVAWTGARGTNVTLKCPGPCIGPPFPPGGAPADDAPGVQAAVGLSALCGNPPVFFPGSVRYWFRKTVNITDQAIRLVGGSGQLAGVVSQGLITDSPVSIQGAEISGGGPVFHFQSSGSVTEVENFAIEAVTTGIKITDCAGVRLYQVGVSVMPPADSKVRPGCGVELGSDNAALVIQNSYWIWIEQSSFIIGPGRGQKGPTCLNPLDSLTCCQGQKPSVILRGGPANGGDFPPMVYLVHFKDINFYGGGVQYQQTWCSQSNYQHKSCDDPKTGKPDPTLAGDIAPGWFSFVNTVLEMSATPLLDVQSDPTLSYNFEGLYAINIANFMHADSVPYRCLDSEEENAQPLATVAHLNCSQTNCALNGLTISGAGYQSGPAVRIIRGRGTLSTFITDPSHSPEVGLYPIVTFQYSSTTLCQVSYHIQYLFF
jgi:hypothetical protein